MRQILKVFFYLLPRFFSDRNFLIFIAYKKLFLYSFLHHRFKKAGPDKEKTVNILGHRISFFSYPILINQFEEIFVYKAYHFKRGLAKPIIVDCGSNIGLSVLYFKILYPASGIIAFEPNPDNFRLLKKNVEQNGFSDITLHACALGKEEGICKLFNYDKGSLNTSIYPSDAESAFVRVPMKKLSSFMQDKIDFMKMDVEGAEGDIIHELAEAVKLEWIKEIRVELHAKSSLSEDELSLILKNDGFALIARKLMYGDAREKLLSFKK
jgi:FkbM family methyltransferase